MLIVDPLIRPSADDIQRFGIFKKRTQDVLVDFDTDEEEGTQTSA